jgi:oligopeptide transport system ATP-binding protein
VPPILQVEDLVVRFYTHDGVVHAVNGISFHVDEGETLAVVGESGCGKSVTMMSLVRLIPMPPGRIESGRAFFFDGSQQRDLLQLPETEIRQVRGGQIGFIFQDPLTSLNPVLSIGEQIAESMVAHLESTRDDARGRAVALLDRVGIPDAQERYSNYPHQFSGGMRQRVMISMALSCNPEILIADEPTTALDVTIQAQILEIIKDLTANLGTAVIIITHDLGVVSGMCSRICVMYAGRMVERADTDDLFREAKHPYTRGLIHSVPRIDKTAQERLYSIPGTPPNLINIPECCPFHPRCKHAMDICRRTYPGETDFGNGHSASCWLYGGENKPSTAKETVPQ